LKYLFKSGWSKKANPIFIRAPRMAINLVVKIHYEDAVFKARTTVQPHKNNPDEYY